MGNKSYTTFSFQERSDLNKNVENDTNMFPMSIEEMTNFIVFSNAQAIYFDNTDSSLFTEKQKQERLNLLSSKIKSIRKNLLHATWEKVLSPIQCMRDKIHKRMYDVIFSDTLCKNCGAEHYLKNGSRCTQCNSCVFCGNTTEWDFATEKICRNPFCLPNEI